MTGRSSGDVRIASRPSCTWTNSAQRLEPPPTDWGELVQVHDDRDIFQGRIDELPAIDIHSL